MRNTEIRFHRKILTENRFWSKSVEDREVEVLVLAYLLSQSEWLASLLLFFNVSEVNAANLQRFTVVFLKDFLSQLIQGHHLLVIPGLSNTNSELLSQGFSSRFFCLLLFFPIVVSKILWHLFFVCVFLSHFSVKSYQFLGLIQCKSLCLCICLETLGKKEGRALPGLSGQEMACLSFSTKASLC